MTTEVKRIRDNGNIETVATYSLPPAEAVVAAFRQSKGDFNTWDYPTPAASGVRFTVPRPDVAVLDVFYGFPRS